MIGVLQAIVNGDAETIEHLAHSIKGEVGYLSLAEVLACASDLEASGRDGNITLAVRLYEGLQAGVAELLPLCAEWLENLTHSTA
jgi:HPt (histidine-containing phosphotransfer) domain-containing protein